MTYLDPEIVARNTPPPGASVVCNGCGDCCDPVNLSPGQWERITEWGRWYSYSDDNVVSDETLMSNEGYGDLPLAVRRAKEQTNRATLIFAYRHWTPIDPEDLLNVRCDKFDAVARACTAHEERPPICRDYPWYGEEPWQERASCLPERCSFRSDPLLEITRKPA